jgi:NAD(P)-dependent dehydrogenase (short-subunit alcohol dehydrogenase family)
MIMLTEEKWVLVTGASTGIGRAVTEFLAAHDFCVYAGARKKGDLDSLAQIENVVSIRLDVTIPEEVSAALDFVKARGTGLYALVNNAGNVVAGPLMDIPTADLNTQFEVNLYGVHRVTRTFFPLILESKGRIIMVSSNAGFFAAPFFGPYNASKFAVEGYSDSLRRELLLYDVKVIIIQPGSINTPIWRKGEALLETFPDSMFEVEARKIGEYAIRKGTTEGLPPIMVAEEVHKALTKKKPKLRYIVAPDRLRNFLLKHFPASWIDKTIKKELEKFKSEGSNQA